LMKSSRAVCVGVKPERPIGSGEWAISKEDAQSQLDYVYSRRRLRLLRRTSTVMIVIHVTKSKV
jgi:hypothetical protein